MHKSIETIYVRDVLIVMLGVLLTLSCLIQRVFAIDGYYNVRWLLTAAILVITSISMLIYKKDDFGCSTLPFVGLVAFLLSSFVSSYLNRNGYMLHVGVFSILMVLDIYLVCQLSIRTDGFGLLCKSILASLAVACLLNDILCIVSDSYYGNGRFLLYSKFYASYLHILLVILYGFLYERSRYPRARFFILAGVCAIMVKYLDCDTAVVGLLCVVIFSICSERIIKAMMNPVTAIVSMVVLSLMLVAVSGILEFPIVRWVITDLFGESSDLNSRRFIYESMGVIFHIKPFFGFGSENNFAACQHYIRLNPYETAPDVQNGLLDWVVSYGIVGTLLAILFIFLCFRTVSVCIRRRSYQTLNSVKWITFLLYAFFLMGSVEIVFDILFFFSLILYLFSGLNGNSLQASRKGKIDVCPKS